MRRRLSVVIVTVAAAVMVVSLAAQAGAQSRHQAPARATTTTVAPRTAVGPLLGALAPPVSNTALRAAGFGEVVIPTTWAAIEPTEGGYSTSAVASLQAQITAANTAGLSPSLDIGVQYPPAWVFNVGGGTRFVDQYGDTFTGSQGSGNNVANAVTDYAVQYQLGAYVTYLGQHLTGLGSVRLGGAAYNELRYPSGGAGSQADAYWFYDTSSQATLPSGTQGWKPGTGTTAQAQTFLATYIGALNGYAEWLETTAAAAFPASTRLEVLMPGWGIRPGELAAAVAGRLVGTPDEVNQGLDWSDLLPSLPANSRTVAYTTYGDATQGGGSNPDPAVFIHSILPAGMASGGESTGNGQTTTAGETLMFTDAHTFDWYVANWFFAGQSQSPAQVAASFAAA